MSIQFIKLFSIILLSLTLVTGEIFWRFGTVRTKLLEHKVAPDVIDLVPNGKLRIIYPSLAVVNYGNVLTPTQVKDNPFVSWNANPFNYYTIIMTDPDEHSRANPNVAEVRHWLVVNIPGSNVNRGQILFDYIGSGPLKDTGLHRYIFLVFKQPGKLQFDEQFVPKHSLRGRLHSKARDFVFKYNLGNPVAGNLYQAQFDNYVPLLHASFTEE